MAISITTRSSSCHVCSTSSTRFSLKTRIGGKRLPTCCHQEQCLISTISPPTPASICRVPRSSSGGTRTTASLPPTCTSSTGPQEFLQQGKCSTSLVPSTSTSNPCGLCTFPLGPS